MQTGGTVYCTTVTGSTPAETAVDVGERSFGLNNFIRTGVDIITDHIAVMYEGKIVDYGETEDVFNNPQHAYTKSLLSAIAIADPDKEHTRKRIA